MNTNPEPPAVAAEFTDQATDPLPPHDRLDTGRSDHEGIMMQLTDLLDVLGQQDVAVASEVPCQENDAEIWFEQTTAGVEFAKALCQTCPVRAICLAGALDRQEPWGVWGGELFDGGAVIARKRPRGRPRKETVAA